MGMFLNLIISVEVQWGFHNKN